MIARHTIDVYIIHNEEIKNHAGEAVPSEFVLQLAANIKRERIDGCDAAYLPTVEELSQHYGVSRPTVLRALGELREQSLIGFRRGSRISVSGRIPQKRVSRDSAADRLCNHLLDDIRKGVYRTGEPLPQVKYLVATKHISPSTVTRAYRTLERDNAVHRRGKQYIVGPSPSAGVVVRAHEQPVILIVCSNENSWKSLVEQSRGGPFGRMFVDLAARHNSALMKVVTEPGTIKFRDRALVAAGGQAQTESLIRSLDHRYIGALISGNSIEVPNIADWQRFLVRFGRPVVWFDRNDDGFRSERFVHRLFYRCHYSEELFVRTAVDFLHSLGHRRAMYCYGFERVEFQERRLEQLQRFGARTEPSLTILPVRTPGVYDLDTCWSPERIAHEINKVYALNIPRLCRAIDLFRNHPNDILRNTGFDDVGSEKDGEFYALIRFFKARREGTLSSRAPYYSQASLIALSFRLTPALSNPAIDAIIAPRDTVAEPYLRWFQELRVRLGHAISLMSFDNHFRYSFLPLTTVDPGFGDLAHRAFHILYQDMPARASRDHDIPIRPYVVNNGSVGVVNV